MKINRRIILEIVIIILLFVLCSCVSRSDDLDVVIDYSNSYFLHYEIEEGKVFIKCHYVVVNNLNSTCSVQLCGNFEKDQQLGLIIEGKLFAKNSIENDITYFEISPGKNEIDVVFVGTFGGTEKKANRLLPDTVLILSDANWDSIDD